MTMTSNIFKVKLKIDFRILLIFIFYLFGEIQLIQLQELSQLGESGKISVSKSTHDLANQYGQYTYRGEIEAKYKGEIDMYFWTKY